jgi:uncharacterized protein YhfF
MGAGLPERVLEFGWRGDDGVGEMLVEQVIKGTKWATCGFKRAYTDAELAEVITGVGHLYTVCSAENPEPRAVIRVTDVFETPFGSPDMRLVAGEGDGEDVEKFQRDHLVAWQADFGDEPPGPEEVLLVELFELVEILDEAKLR